MNEFISELGYFVASYFGVALALFFLLQWQTKGYVGTFLKVKMSRGRKQLAKIQTKTDIYYSAGFFEGNRFRYKGRDKKWRSFADVPSECLYSEMGVFCLEIDEDKNKVIDRLKVTASEQSMTVVDDLIREAQESPRLENNKDKILFIVVIGIALAVVYLIYQQSQLMGLLEGIQQLSGLIQ